MANGDSAAQSLSIDELRDRLDSTAFAFRGYNVTNLGRTPELLAHEHTGTHIREALSQASTISSDILGRRVDLIARVEKEQETSLETYDEAIAMILAVEIGQLTALRERFGIDYKNSRFLFGFSLGEIAALVAAGSLEFEDALRIPLAMAHDAAQLAEDVTLGVLFSRAAEVSIKAVDRLCQKINQAGDGVMGISAYLAPNSMLLIGQNDTLDRFSEHMGDLAEQRVYLRRNDNRWPPLHTPIIWQSHIPDRSKHLMHTLRGGFDAPTPNVFSLVTGDFGYDDTNIRDLIGRWIDHPQRLWDAVDYTLSTSIDQIIHVGPAPNIIPATFTRLANNVEAQTKGSIRMRALSNIVGRPWLQTLLPKRASLLRAVSIKHVNLEDLLLTGTRVSANKN